MSEITIAEAKTLLRNLVAKAEEEKKKWNYRQSIHQARCILCLNFEPGPLIRGTEEYKVFNRSVRVGACHAHGWEVSSADTCDSWQDDA